MTVLGKWLSPSKKLTIVHYDDMSIWINGRKIRLTQTEEKVFLCIVSGEGKVRTHRMILQAMYGNKKQSHQKIIDVIVNRIRKKLSLHTPSAARALMSVWGRGYVFGKIKPPTGVIAQVYPIGYWVPSRKEQVLLALLSGQFSTEEVMYTHPDLSQEELDEWRSTYNVFGRKGLHSSKAQKYLV